MLNVPILSCFDKQKKPFIIFFVCFLRRVPFLTFLLFSLPHLSCALFFSGVLGLSALAFSCSRAFVDEVGHAHSPLSLLSHYLSRAVPIGAFRLCLLSLFFFFPFQFDIHLIGPSAAYVIHAVFNISLVSAFFFASCSVYLHYPYYKIDCPLSYCALRFFFFVILLSDRS
jgi:hypothetical protein